MKIQLKDGRLTKRWEFLVRSQTKVASPLAAGVGSLPSHSKPFAATQAAWRFYNNERVELQELIVPLRDYARQQIASSTSAFVLVAHDWCKLSYPGQASRSDMAVLSNDSDVGYELTTSLAICADDGAPLAPVEMHMKMADGILSTRGTTVEVANHLDQVLPTMHASASWNLGKPIVHVIDREADSLDHYRQWIGAGHKILIRGDDRYVLCDGQHMKLSEIRKLLDQQKAFQLVGPALYHGRAAFLEVAEVSVDLNRAGRKRKGNQRIIIPGACLTMRLILTRIVSKEGQVLAQWYLLSNVPVAWADAAKLARCYYWRWRIESYFKLLKSHGFQLEDWRQETAGAIARRILVVSMASVTVWHLMADDSPAATQFKQVLMRMSGRQTKRSRPFTAPALLAGLSSLLATLETLETIDLVSLKSLISKVNLPIPLFTSR
jgi:Transposase DDE domain